MAHPGYQLDEVVTPPRPEQVVFSVGATAYRRRHLLEAARIWGEWDPIVREAREGLACAVRATERGDPLDPSAAAAAGAAWRRAHGLLAADELEVWLGERDVGVADWLAHIRQELLRGAWRDELDAVVNVSEAPEHADLLRTVWARAVCSGTVAELAERLAEEAAAEATFECPEEPALDNPSFADAEISPAALARLRAADERLSADAVTEERIARELEMHRVAWASVDCLMLVHPDLDVLKEAALCVTEDGLELADVASESGAELLHERLVLGELPAEIATRLFNAEPGELLEPVAVEDTAWLALVEAKTMPSPSAPELRERAAELIAARERARAVDRWIRWHERF
jgi:hypothetical protein